MTSGLTGSRAAMQAALEAASLRVYPDPTGEFSAPCIRLHAASPWVGASMLRAGSRTQRWEVWAVAGRADSGAALAELEELVSAATIALDSLPGWSSIEWERPGPTDMGGVKYLATRGIIETIREV